MNEYDRKCRNRMISKNVNVDNDATVRRIDPCSIMKILVLPSNEIKHRSRLHVNEQYCFNMSVNIRCLI
jgi:hypothetical protein